MVANTISLSEVLRGCDPGRIQSVGFMQVIPLISDLVDDSFATPDSVGVSTHDYGTLSFDNQSDGNMIIPAHATYVVKQAAQDHAMTHASIIAAKESRSFNTAACVQQTQGGYIRSGSYNLIILPFPLREKAHELRKRQDYSKLWPSISNFNSRAGVNADGHLEHFLKHYKEELEQFVAEFEPVPKQVGAVVLVSGNVVGIERVPNYKYWLSVWKPLIRNCYGSLAILEAKEQGEPPVPKTRVPLRDDTISLDDLETALEEVTSAEYDAAKELVNRICESNMSRKTEDTIKGTAFTLDSLSHDRFVGQIVCDGDKVIYSSLVATKAWAKNADWFEAKKFKM